MIETDFIYRKQYKAGAKTESDRIKSTFEFFKNIESNPYTFCLRGVGNFSVRLYETLAMGRIPVVVDTDFRLPLDQSIDWSKHCLIFKEKDLEQGLIDFHKRITPEAFAEMQIGNRKLWMEYLAREGYFSQKDFF